MICERWKKASKYKDELSNDEIFKMLEDAKKAGIMMYVVEGGEPLLRKDLSEILKYAKELEYITTVVTNGYYLKDRYNEILPFTDSIVVSIDSNNELHDQIRCLKGLLKKAVEGIQLCQKNNSKIIINSVLCKINLKEIEGLVKLSKELNIPIIFQPMDIYKGYNEHLRPTQDELIKTFSKIYEYKKAGYNIENSYNYLRFIISKKNYICRAPECYIYVESNGNIVSCCDIIDKVWGNVKEKQFLEIFHEKQYKEFCKKMKTCNECSVSAVVEASLLYSINPKHILKQIIRS
jgi:MoaA/NifB/PqqE/SkfB family radical SAM enzyme